MISKFNKVSAWQFFQLYRFSALILVNIMFTKGLLELSEIGIYETLLLIASIFTSFWVTSFTQTLLAQGGKYLKEEEKSPIFFNAFLILLIFSITVCGFLFLFSHQLTQWLKLKDSQAFAINFRWYLVYLLISCPAYLTEYILLLKQKVKPLLAYGSVIFSLQIVLTIVPVFLGYGIQGAVYGLIVWAILRFLITIASLIKYSRFQIDWVFCKQYLMYGIFMMLATVAGGYNQYFDGIIISKYFDAIALTLFMYGARELPISSVLASSLSEVMLQEIGAGKLKEALQQIKEKSLQLMHWLFPISAVLMLSSHFLFPLVYNAAFKESASIFNIYLLLIISRLVFPQTIIMGMQKAKWVFGISLTETILNISASILLIPFFGLEGVALGTIIAYFFNKLVLMYFNQKLFSIKISEYIPVKIWISYSIALLIVFGFVECFF